MTFADASALVAVIQGESDAPSLAGRLDAAAGSIWISPLVRFEVVTAVARARARDEGRVHVSAQDVEVATGRLDALLTRIDARETPLTPEIGRLALDAAARFGKLVGQPARLNMGDCFSHACAQSLGATLLYKGDDFSRTDLA